MARKPPPEHTRFKPGQSGNPGGKVKVPEDIREARKLNQHELERMINRLIYLPRDELKKLATAPTTPMLEVMVANIVDQAATKGDPLRLDFILNRLIGKVQDRVEVSAKPYIVRNLDGSVHAELGARTEDQP